MSLSDTKIYFHTEGIALERVEISETTAYSNQMLNTINKTLKKYGVQVVKGKGMMTVIDDILDGVIEVDEEIDNVIYYIVDKYFLSWYANVKKVVSNGIRLILAV